MGVMIYFTIDKKKYDAACDTEFWEHLKYSRSTGSFVCVRGSHPCLYLECLNPYKVGEAVMELMPLVSDFDGKLMISILD
jgi:hypothetical protein